MGELNYDPNLLAEIAHRLDLREPNRKAVETVALRTTDHYDVEENTDVYECIVDSATGVGKTYVMAGLIEYFAGRDRAARNFLLLAPGRTIRDKSIRNFTPGDAKSLTAAMRSQPFLVYRDNFNSPATFAAMNDPSVTKVYVFTVQSLLEPSSDDGRATHDFQESLGASFYEWLAAREDLVVLADEHHCYRGPAFSRTIDELHPSLVVGLTATPDPRDVKADLVAYRYPLAAAIAHQVVKTPIMVGRRDDRNDDETKLLDGVTLLRHKEQALAAYCDENGLPMINPVMLVIAKDQAEAEHYQSILDSVGFDGGAWVGKTLLIHSSLNANEKQKALADLEAVEHPDSPVRIIINVAMLKEGWDVKNVYVIASMRASVSEVMTEQTLGRGMRLPFGRYTGIELLDTVEVIAHEKYSDLLAKRKVLNQAFIDYGTYAATRVTPSGKTVVAQLTTQADRPVIGIASNVETPNGETVETPAEEIGGVETSTESEAAEITSRTGIVDIDTRTHQAEVTVEQIAEKVKYEPVADREPILIPRIRSVPTAAAVSLNDIDTNDYTRFDELGRAFASSSNSELKRTKIVARVEGNTAVTDTEAASDHILATLALDIPLSTSRRQLLNYVMAVKGVQPRPLEFGAAERIVDRVITAMGAEASVYLSAYGERCGQRLASTVQSLLSAISRAQVTYSDSVGLVTLDKVREANKRPQAGHADGAFSKTVAFNGWAKNLYTHAWFDSSLEYKAANAIDAGDTVVVWARLHINDLPITWTADGRRYNPDFVVIEEIDGKRYGWLVETKADKDLSTADVVAKRQAARKWTNTVNSSPEVAAEWGYLLVGEKDVEHAEGSWAFLKSVGQQSS